MRTKEESGGGENSESRIQIPEGGTGNVAGLWLVTLPHFAGRVEKMRLASLYGAAFVDMEAFGLARVAEKEGIPFYCVKAISDGPHENLPDFNRFFDTSESRFRLMSFIFFAVLRPWLWPALMRLGAYSNQAARDLRRLVLSTLEERDMANVPPHSTAHD